MCVASSDSSAGGHAAPPRKVWRNKARPGERGRLTLCIGVMASQRDLIERLTTTWNATWPQTPPIAFLLRDLHPDLWVRFHSLPESKRYADTDGERGILLWRHHAVLQKLGLSSRCFVIARFASDLPRRRRAPVEYANWQTIDGGGDDDYFAEPAPLYVALLTYPSTEVADVLMAVAEEYLLDVILAPNDLRWLYSPYDGGADVIASSTTHRDQLRASFESWLSPHPEGL